VYCNKTDSNYLICIITTTTTNTTFTIIMRWLLGLLLLPIED